MLFLKIYLIICLISILFFAIGFIEILIDPNLKRTKVKRSKKDFIKVTIDILKLIIILLIPIWNLFVGLYILFSKTAKDKAIEESNQIIEKIQKEV